MPNYTIEKLQSRRETLLRRMQADENAEQRMSEIMETLQNGELDISEYDDALVRKLVGSVTVISDKLTVTFRNGTEILDAW